MNNIGLKSLIWIAGAGLLAQSVVATVSASGNEPELSAAEIQTDTINGDLSGMIAEPEVSSQIVAMARSYGDSVVLRWATNDYVEWVYLRNYGVDIYRVDRNAGTFRIDTLARALKPLSLEKFRKVYPDTVDSLAYAAMGVLYGKNGLKEEQTEFEPGSTGALMELYEEQKLRLAYGLMISEWRKDLADAMALRFVDKTIKKGGSYDYFIAPSVQDTTGKFPIEQVLLSEIKADKYVPQPYDVEVNYEITGHGQATFTWTDPDNSSFEIYRRKNGDTEWVKANTNPYMPQYQGNVENQVINYNDKVDEIGAYEYCIAAHDVFGDLTQKTKPLQVLYPDRQPPVGPEITRIIIDRNGKTDYDSVFARIYFRKDTFENDFVRYVPLYYNERDSLKQWRLLTDKYIAPTDTVVNVDVTNVSTGMVTIAAVDTADNMGYAFPRLLRVEDMKPPVKPEKLKAVSDLDGTVLLTWKQPDSLDVRQYEVFYSNAMDHLFQQKTRGAHKETSFMDTLSTNANERYIYYAVRAIDFAGNVGPMSDTIRVLRPNPNVPTVAHLDSAWVDAAGIHSLWYGGADAMIREYNVYSRLEGQAEWKLLKRFDGDSVAADKYQILVNDKPEPNRMHRYQYAVETVSFWDISSGLSLVYSDWFKGDKYVDIPVKLYGRYDAESGETRLAWEANAIPAGDYRFCIYRKTIHDKTFQYVISEPVNVLSHINHLEVPGETSQYYIMIYYSDGRESQPSNIVDIVAPKVETKENNKK